MLKLYSLNVKLSTGIQQGSTLGPIDFLFTNTCDYNASQAKLLWSLRSFVQGVFVFVDSSTVLRCTHDQLGKVQLC